MVGRLLDELELTMTVETEVVDAVERFVAVEVVVVMFPLAADPRNGSP
jgi:hypothetical protein